MINVRRTTAFFLAAIMGIALSACQSSTGGVRTVDEATQATVAEASETPESEKLRVITTIFPSYDFVRQIAGDSVELSMLLSPGSESHSYDPTPQDIIAIQNSDVFIRAGGESEQWVDRILESMDGSSVVVLSMIDMVEAVEEEIVEGMQADHGHDEPEEDDDHEEAADLDEHVWTAPKNAAVIAGVIADELCRLDGANADAYLESVQEYRQKLDELDRAFETLMGGAVRRTVVFGDRFPFRYLADAYGLEYYAAFPGCSTETEASASTVAFLIDKVRDEEIPVIFHIELSNEKMADTISEGTGAKKLMLHSCHNVSRDDFRDGVTYVELMERNLEHLKEALQ